MYYHQGKIWEDKKIKLFSRTRIFNYNFLFKFFQLEIVREMSKKNLFNGKHLEILTGKGEIRVHQSMLWSLEVLEFSLEFWNILKKRKYQEIFIIRKYFIKNTWRNLWKFHHNECSIYGFKSKNYKTNMVVNLIFLGKTGTCGIKKIIITLFYSSRSRKKGFT